MQSVGYAAKFSYFSRGDFSSDGERNKPWNTSPGSGSGVLLGERRFTEKGFVYSGRSLFYEGRERERTRVYIFWKQRRASQRELPFTGRRRTFSSLSLLLLSPLFLLFFSPPPKRTNGTGENFPRFALCVARRLWGRESLKIAKTWPTATRESLNRDVDRDPESHVLKTPRSRVIISILSTIRIGE